MSVLHLISEFRLIGGQSVSAEEPGDGLGECKSNRGSGGVDGQNLEAFGAQLDQQLDRLQRELKEDTYRPQPVRQVQIPKAGKPGEFRMLGVPIIYDRVCQQALFNRLEPIFEPVFEEANFGYRRGQSTKHAMRKVWKEIQSGREWIVDADLRDFFGSVDHEKLLTLIAQRIADGRALRLIRAMLKAGSYGEGRLFPSERGTPQGSVVSPLLSNILLTPFDQEMRRKGYQLTRFADDWVVTSICDGGASGHRRRPPDSERSERATASAENASGARSAWIRISGLLGQARTAAEIADEQDRHGCQVGRLVCLSPREIDPALQGSSASAYQAKRSFENQRSDRAPQPSLAGLGALLQTCPRPNALQQT